MVGEKQLLGKAGFGRCALPSPVGVELCGYGYFLERKCVGVDDDLYVRCMALSSDEGTSIVFSADLIGLADELASEVRRLVGEKLGLSGRDVMLVCTHTHTGPSTNRLEGGGVMDAEYNSRVPQAFLKAAEYALADMADVESLEEACKAIEPVGYNRNIADGPHDAVVRGMLIRRKGAEPIAAISYPCHAVVVGPSNKASADYPGAVCRMGEEKGMKTIFLNGCCGDINPLIQRIKWGSGTMKEANEYASRILEGFIGGLHGTDDRSLGRLEFDVTVHVKPMDEKGIDDIAERGYNKEVAALWRKTMLLRLPIHDDVVKVRVVKVGPFCLCSIPFETFTFVGEAVRQAYPGRNIVVLGCADHVRSYLPPITPESQYSYPVVDAALFYLYPVIAVGAAESVAEQISKGIKELF